MESFKAKIPEPLKPEGLVILLHKSNSSFAIRIVVARIMNTHIPIIHQDLCFEGAFEDAEVCIPGYKKDAEEDVGEELGEDFEKGVWEGFGIGCEEDFEEEAA